MVQRSSIAPASDLRSLRKGGGKGPPSHALSLLRRAAGLVILLVLVYVGLRLVSPGSFGDHARAAMGVAVAAAEWVRAASAAAFHSIPVR